MNPFDIIASFSNKNTDFFEEGMEERDYQPWIINKGLSFNMDTILFANEMNKYYELDKRIQHDFYWHGIPKGKRYGKWVKLEKNEVLTMLMDFYCINKIVAATYLKLLSEEQLLTIQEKMNKGGRHGGSK